MSRPKIGQILAADGQETRDAIHFPIIRVIAAYTLRPGDSICLTKQGDGRVIAKAGFYDQKRSIIVDPFLETLVHEGEAFYAFMLPESTQSLWQDWTHKAVDDLKEKRVKK